VGNRRLVGVIADLLQPIHNGTKNDLEPALTTGSRACVAADSVAGLAAIADIDAGNFVAGVDRDLSRAVTCR
jgi:hypothetical protein